MWQRRGCSIDGRETGIINSTRTLQTVQKHNNPDVSAGNDGGKMAKFQRLSLSRATEMINFEPNTQDI